MNKKLLLLPVILLGYSLLYIATSYHAPCEGDCEKTTKVSQSLRENRPYVNNVYRCTYQPNSDTLCIYVNDTTGIDWNLFADTVCMTATQYGLPQQKIFVLKFSGAAYDTVAKKVCP